jgi:hypothetical protein
MRAFRMQARSPPALALQQFLKEKTPMLLAVIDAVKPSIATSFFFSIFLIEQGWQAYLGRFGLHW